MSCSAYRGNRAFLTLAQENNGLDESQVQSIYHMARRKARVSANDPTKEQWQAFVDRELTALALDREMDQDRYVALYRRLESAREMDPPDAATFAALKDMRMRAQKGKSAVRRQLASAAALQGVSEEEAWERFNAFRDQYRNDFRGLPASERPDPPREWVTGYTKRDMMAVSSPQDRATLYAMYRCQADPDAFGDRGQVRYASVDLETAGPAGKDGFDPANGSIIEVGIVEYDAAGREVGRYSQLVRPAPAVEATCGTGAVEIHGITVEDVRDAPSWQSVAPEVSRRLSGRVMLAQNARYERDWLTHHMGAEEQPFDRYGPTVDTMLLAKQHLDVPNHRLATICEATGVAYTDGHRATHDAVVAAQAFFQMRKMIAAKWAESPARARAPHPPAGAGARSRVVRMSAGDFDPVTVQDPWTIRVPATRGAAA